MSSARSIAPLLICVVSLALAAPAGSDTNHPRLVRVKLGASLPISALLEAGLDVVDVKGTTEAQILEWPGDDTRLARLGAVAEPIDENPGRTAAVFARSELSARPRPAPEPVLSAARPDGVFRRESLPPFGSGSMGGYWTAAEIKMKLDQMVADDVNDVVADKIDTLGYGRDPNHPIWGLKLGKRVEGPDNRPVVFYNALTHAREPGGMQTLFYFVDDLLGGYGSDPFATYLLDHRVIYIVPLVNPDGYAINEQTYFGSGSFGMWRKNTRDNNANSVFEMAADGVDINRNYGYKWGLNNIGSSGSPIDETYRGPAAFSEPETMSQRDIVALLKPTTGLSFHTYSDLMIHPWGWTTAPVPFPDIDLFKTWSDELTRDNSYISGAAPAILYAVNGEFNDWCYGDSTKPKMYSWTPEIGHDVDGFWPPPSRIVPLAQENLRACYVVAAIAGPWVQEDGYTIDEGALNAGHGATLRVRARFLGATGFAGPDLHGTIIALDPGVRVLDPIASYPTLQIYNSADPEQPFGLAVDDTITPGRLVRFEVDFTTPEGFFARDTVSIPLGTPTLVNSDDASSGLGKWTPGMWNIVSNNPEHPSRFFADSPAGNYPSNSNNTMTLVPPLDLSHGVHAYALFEARWDIETGYDAAAIEASVNGTAYQTVRSTGSISGSGIGGGVQAAGLPYFSGSRRTWKTERTDLSAFTGPAGSAARLRFRMASDAFSVFDGFNFDSLRIEVYDPAAQPAPVAVGGGIPVASLELAAPFPNPARGLVRLGFALPRAGRARLEILDVQGRRVRLLADGTLAADRYVRGWDARDAAGRPVPPGVYLARLTGETGRATRRFVVME